MRIVFQRLTTARGFTFITLEDESSRMQINVPLKVYLLFETVLRSSALVIGGRV